MLRLRLMSLSVGPAFDGSPTPVNIIAANVYERLTADLFEEFERIETETRENLDGILAKAEQMDTRQAWPPDLGLLMGIRRKTQRVGSLKASRMDAVLDSLPNSPLSGEWADAPTPASLLADYGLVS